MTTDLQAATARYAAELLTSLERLADEACLTELSYFVAMAKIQANSWLRMREIVKSGLPPEPEPFDAGH